eukprot:m.103553 g.103553  ORF g.103553 m.103553 type:complete len:371 (+) comp15719_c0_seq2:89-1201(+)
MLLSILACQGRRVAVGLAVQAVRAAKPCAQPVARLHTSSRLHTSAIPPEESYFRRKGRVFLETFFYSPVQTLVGVAIGGLGASLAGFIFFQHLRGRIDLQEMMHKVHKPGDPFNVPLPAVSVAGWTVVFALTSLVAWSQARFRLQYRHFMSHVNFSLNSLDKRGALRIRTINELKLSDVLPDNPAAVKLVMSQAGNCTMSNPIVEFPADVSHFLNNSILNRLSPVFAEGFFAADMGVPVARTWFRFALTYEPDVGVARKLRVMIIKDSDLRRIANSAAVPLLEQKSHNERWSTLQAIAKQAYGKDGHRIVPFIEGVLPYQPAAGAPSQGIDEAMLDPWKKLDSAQPEEASAAAGTTSTPPRISPSAWREF